MIPKLLTQCTQFARLYRCVSHFLFLHQKWKLIGHGAAFKWFSALHQYDEVCRDLILQASRSNPRLNPEIKSCEGGGETRLNPGSRWNKIRDSHTSLSLLSRLPQSSLNLPRSLLCKHCTYTSTTSIILLCHLSKHRSLLHLCRSQTSLHLHIYLVVALVICKMNGSMAVSSTCCA